MLKVKTVSGISRFVCSVAVYAKKHQKVPIKLLSRWYKSFLLDTPKAAYQHALGHFCNPHQAADHDAVDRFRFI